MFLCVLINNNKAAFIERDYKKMTKALYNKNEETSYSTKITLLQKSNYNNNKNSIKWKQDEVMMEIGESWHCFWTD